MRVTSASQRQATTLSSPGPRPACEGSCQAVLEGVGTHSPTHLMPASARLWARVWVPQWWPWEASHRVGLTRTRTLKLSRSLQLDRDKLSRALALNPTVPHSVPGTSHDPLALPGVILECRIRRTPGIQLSVDPKQKPITIF